MKIDNCPQCHSDDKRINFWDDTQYVCNKCWFGWIIKDDIQDIRKKKLKKLNSFWLRIKLIYEEIR